MANRTTELRAPPAGVVDDRISSVECTRAPVEPRIPFCLYVLYRFVLAAYFIALLIAYVILAAKTLGPKFLIYYESWTYTSATCYVYLALFNAVVDFRKSRKKNAALEDKFRYQIQWCLFNLTATPSIIVTTFDWGPLYFANSEKVSLLLYVSIYLLPNVVCLIEIFLTLIIVRFVHAVYPALFMIIYLLFITIYWAAGGTDPFGNHFTYYLLDFENYPSIAAATVVGITFAVLLVQVILKGLYAFRVRCMDRRRTEAVRARRKEEPEAAQLKAQTE
ncbi:protein rolling stone-like [Diadema setosum]|uniref:protein rolling stone-like n=1 Tax=Diadema setosum TaxID=31175 RepID=UPI003B3A2374